MHATSDRPVIIVTGCSGRIGTRVMKDLCGDYRIVGLDIEEPAEAPSGAAWYKCDLTSDDSVTSTLSEVCNRFGAEVAGIVHLAAYYDFSGKPSPMYRKLTVEGTRRLMRGAACFDRVGRFVFSSSLLVMAPVEKEAARITEESPTQAEWDYPQSKLQAEAALRESHGDVPVVILRLAGAYDEGCHSLPLSQQIRRIYEKDLESYFFPGDADHGQPFIHFEDTTSSIRAAIERRETLGDFELFLIAEPEVVSYAELQDELGRLIHGEEWPTIRVPKAAAKTVAKIKERFPDSEEFIKPWMIDLADDHYPVEIRRAQSRLGWTPRRRLRTTLPAMVANLRKSPRAWYEENGLPVPEEISS